MDGLLAKKMAAALLGKSLQGWTLEDFTGAYGKSALVFKATKHGQVVALKVFDPDLIERFGSDVQAERIRRQLTLKDKYHPNLVKIVDGGYSDALGLWFIAMEFLEAPSMARILTDIPRDRIRPLISQLASAARFLEDLELAHRDIKPDNIVIHPGFEKCTLLDLGVIRPFAAERLTDVGDQRRFVGTLQYGPPEFIFRTERDTLDGWRAVTFYQLGAVLHDMLMKKQLFEEFLEPYPRLVEAVRHTYPAVAAPDAPSDLVLLARNCLLKDPELRLKVIDWSDFESVRSMSATTDAKDRLRRRQAHYNIVRGDILDDQQQRRLERRTLSSIRAKIQEAIRAECIASDLFPPMEIHDALDESAEARFFVWFGASEDMGLRIPLSIMYDISVLDLQSQTIELRCAAVLTTAGERDWTRQVESPAAAIFRGVFDDAGLLSALQETLYPTLDRALDTLERLAESGTPFHQGTIPLPMGPLHG